MAPAPAPSPQKELRRPRGSGVRGGLAGPVGENGLGERGYGGFKRGWWLPWRCHFGCYMRHIRHLWLWRVILRSPGLPELTFGCSRRVPEVGLGSISTFRWVFWVSFDLTFLPLRAFELCVVDNFVKVCCGDGSRLKT